MTDFTLTLHGVPNDRRSSLLRELNDAILIAATFARDHYWHRHIERAFFSAAEIWSQQDAFWKRLIQLARLPPESAMPTDGIAAALEGKTLVAVTPQEYARVRPEYSWEPDAWTRLIAHELIHVLHVRLLSGDETRMGPEWFYEGFAIIGAGQQLGSEIEYGSSEEAFRACRRGGRGSYARYAAALRFFMSHASLKELLAQAGSPGFEEWLASIDQSV